MKIDDTDLLPVQNEKLTDEKIVRELLRLKAWADNSAALDARIASLQQELARAQSEKTLAILEARESISVIAGLGFDKQTLEQDVSVAFLRECDMLRADSLLPERYRSPARRR